ncbi:MAG: DUF87 domain-containing protein [Lachnospiraceae bacterium]|nr:DUF87 domain-containing protein [Lachnospiraceae bacterium]MBP3505969.1 DUF87 domain-containing protein [Lachnospiraceae bacterium]
MKQKRMKENAALLNVISPISLEYGHNSMLIGENKAKGYGIIRYGTEPEYGWLSKVTNLPNSIVSITYEPLDTEDMINVLDSNINAAKKRAVDAKKASDETRAEKEIKNSRKMLDEMDDKNESVGLMSTVVVSLANEETFDKADRKARATAKKAGCRLRCLTNLQKETYKQVSPAYIPSEDIRQVTGRVTPLSTLIGGFPFAKSGLNDGEGYYFAKDDDGGIVTLNPWKRVGDRTNSNMAILGGSGTGKSTKMKDLLTDEYMMGSKIIVIDPEDEYKEQCKVFEGNWLNAAGGASCRINPLQIQTIPKEDDDEYYRDEGHGMGPLALYLKHLETFFSLYIPSLDDFLLAHLKMLLIELYNSKGINFQTDVTNLTEQDYPIVEELVQLAKIKADAFVASGNSGENYYEKIALLLWDAAFGADAFLFNGYTTIMPENQYICISTSGLNDASDRIKRTQYFNILTWAWNEISKNRNQRVILVCDEAYLLVDQQIPQSLIFLRNAMKRARKYEAAIWVITQNIVDFLGDSVKTYGQELLDNPTYKILMGADGANLQKLVELYHLTEQEAATLEAKRRAQAILMLGARRMKIHFDIPDYKFNYFGTAGGR